MKFANNDGIDHAAAHIVTELFGQAIKAKAYIKELTRLAKIGLACENIDKLSIKDNMEQ